MPATTENGDVVALDVDMVTDPLVRGDRSSPGGSLSPGASTVVLMPRRRNAEDAPEEPMRTPSDALTAAHLALKQWR